MKKKSIFPDPKKTTPQGLLAVGANLSPQILLDAYQSGIFPWYREDGLIHWYSPPKRMVLVPSEIKISHSMKQVLNSKKFLVSENKAFNQVIQNCAEVHSINEGSTWIDEGFISAYISLHELGYAQSIEVWNEEKLVGGLYGVTVGKMFCGESMFSKVSNASKVALIHLCKNKNYSLIDCQLPTVHLMNIGAKLISRDKYLSLLGKFLSD